MPEFETDADRTYMINTIKIPEKFVLESENFGQKNDRSFYDKNYEKVVKESKSATYRYLFVLMKMEMILY